MASFADGSSSAMGTKHTAQIPNSVQKQHRDNLMSQPSFYQRELPQTCVAFASGEGKKLFRSALENEGLKSFYNLIEQHHTQTEPAFCGVSTLVMVLNALAVDPGQLWKGPWRWYEEKMLNCCVDLEEIKKGGITLRDFQCLALCQGLSVELEYCDEASGLENFRRAVERACLEQPMLDDDSGDSSRDDRRLLECLVVSYSRKVLRQTGDGHFSPLAAFDKASDSVLILDTARFKYGAHWTKLPLVFEAMKPIDKDTGKSRGYAILSFVPESKDDDFVGSTAETKSMCSDSSCGSSICGVSSKCTAIINTSKLSTQPTSILFRSKMNQKERRKRYKEYIKSLREGGTYKEAEDIPYEVVRAYWCPEDTHGPVCVWEIIIPLRMHNEDEMEILNRMRLFLAQLLGATIDNSDLSPAEKEDIHRRDCYHRKDCSGKSPGCGVSVPTNSTAYVNAEETLFLIYLATLSEERRNTFVMSFESEASDVVRRQIIKEADMIASAIEVSDQLTSL